MARASDRVPPAGRLGVLATDLSVLLVAVIWGSSYVVMQDVGRSVSAASFLALRFLTAIPAMVLMAAPTLSKISRSEVLSGVAFGSLLYGILILETIGVQYTSAADSGFLITVSVVLVPVFERIVSRRRQPLMVYAATVTALAGCGLLLLSDGLHPRPGDLIILAAAFLRATQITLFGRRTAGTAPQSLPNLTLVEFAVVFALAASTSAFTGAPVWEAAGSVSAGDWLLIAYLGVLGTSYSFFVQLRAARRSSPTRVGLLLATEPLFATAFALIAAGESIGIPQGLGGALIVVAATVGRRFEGRAAPAGLTRPVAPPDHRRSLSGRSSSPGRTRPVS